jgi:hypothetical protein
MQSSKDRKSERERETVGGGSYRQSRCRKGKFIKDGSEQGKELTVESLKACVTKSKGREHEEKTCLFSFILVSD